MTTSPIGTFRASFQNHGNRIPPIQCKTLTQL